LQGCGPRGKPKSHISCSQQCKKVWGNEPPQSQMNSHFGSWSPDGLPNLQRAIVAVKTHYIEFFLISLENYWNLNVWIGLAWPIWTSKTQVMAKRKVGSQTIKSRELTQFPCVQVTWNIPLESFWQGLQLCFKLHLNWRSSHKVTKPQSRDPKSRKSRLWEFQDPHLGVPGQNAIWMWASWRGNKYTIKGKVVASPKYGPWWVLRV
jgi:hypothetical protein